MFHLPCVHARQYPDDLLQHFHKRCFNSAVGGLWVWFTKHAHWPCELAPVTLLPPCLSPPRPDHTAPVTTVLALPTGYNYSAFCCSPFSLSLSCFLCLSLSLSARLGLDTEVQAEGRRAGGALCSQRTERHSLHRGSEQVGGGDAKGAKGSEGGGCYSLDAKASGLEGRWGWSGCTRGPAAQQPTYPPLPFPLSISTFLSHFLSLSASVPGLQAGRLLGATTFCPSACWRRDASELSTMEKSWRGGGGRK